jgi:hypothetical protein
LILGLTGGYCAGKNEVAAILGSLGWTCVDVDAMGHRALEYCLPEVVKLLGPVCTETGRAARPQSHRPSCLFRQGVAGTLRESGTSRYVRPDRRSPDSRRSRTGWQGLPECGHSVQNAPGRKMPDHTGGTRPALCQAAPGHGPGWPGPPA